MEKIPIKLSPLDKKWSIEIIEDLFKGKSKFSDFLKNNTGLSNRILSQRLKELGEEGFIEKTIKSAMPMKIEYRLTEKGISLRRALKELAMISFKSYAKKFI